MSRLIIPNLSRITLDIDSRKDGYRGLVTFKPSMCLKSSLFTVQSSRSCSKAVAAIIASPRLIRFACLSCTARLTIVSVNGKLYDSSNRLVSMRSSFAGIVEKPSASILVTLACPISVLATISVGNILFAIYMKMLVSRITIELTSTW